MRWLAVVVVFVGTAHAQPPTLELDHHRDVLAKLAVDFDHDTTRFPLRGGGHRVLPCARCHTKQLASALPPMRCEGCHAERPHGKRFTKVPKGCTSCHVGSRWTANIAFEHLKHTRFALVGKHAQLRCDACHRGPAFERVGTGCKECHAHRAVHADVDHPQGKFTTAQCLGCHTSNLHEPRPILAMFHGPRSLFPLANGHKNVPCVECHTTRTPRGKTAFDGLAMECGPACHPDVVHAGTLGATCSRCHVPGVWTTLKLDPLP